MTSILVVDDDALITDVMVNFFEDEGYSVRVAESGESALAVLDSFNPDFLLSDLRLPGMDGFSLVAAVLDRKPGVKCLIMSGALEDIPPALLLKGISEKNMLQKPAMLTAIEERILSL
jgi:CheY-like chemotaxis protein